MTPNAEDQNPMDTKPPIDNMKPFSCAKGSTMNSLYSINYEHLASNEESTQPNPDPVEYPEILGTIRANHVIR